MTLDVQPSSDPIVHVRNIRDLLGQVADHARADVEQVEDPRARALFETTAEVLLGMQRAYDHCEAGAEAAWRRDG